MARGGEAKKAMERLPLTLRMERGPGEGTSFPATHLKRVTIGRTRVNNYPIKDPTVSQRHAVLEWRADRWVLVDVGSSNGTDVNGTKLVENEPVTLQNGDAVRFGEGIKVRVQIEEEEEDEEEIGEVQEEQEVDEEEEEQREEVQEEQEDDEQREEVQEEQEDEEPGVTVEEWFEQERQRIVQTVHARAQATISEMKESAEQLKKMYREHAGVD